MSGTIAVVVLIAVVCIASFPDKKNKEVNNSKDRVKKNSDKFTVVSRESKPEDENK